MTYQAPIDDMLFCVEELAELQGMAQLLGLDDAGSEIATAVLQECAKFTQNVIAPLNVAGDETPSVWKDGVVTMTPGFQQAYRQFVEAGWQSLQHPQDYGGQGLPKAIGSACTEMFNSANMSFALCPLLTDGAIEALITAGSDELKSTYLEKLVSGEWTGTMNLTEPQAGSDLALIRTKAEPQADGTYKLFGTKVFITYGEHDMADNIVHLVLARVPGAPEGVKGISLFLCPKFLVHENGSLGERNDVHCMSIEHKLGIHGNATAVLNFDGARGWLVGEVNKGMNHMFIMMNAARYDVGVQGIGVSERAYQHAVAYARERVQSRPVDGSMNKSAPRPRMIAARRCPTPCSWDSGATTSATAPVAAEIMAGRPPTIAVVTAMVKEANRPTRGSTPAMIENAMASGISASATTTAASTSVPSSRGLRRVRRTDCRWSGVRAGGGAAGKAGMLPRVAVRGRGARR